jgi:hypothetical protein
MTSAPFPGKHLAVALIESRESLRKCRHEAHRLLDGRGIGGFRASRVKWRLGAHSIASCVNFAFSSPRSFSSSTSPKSMPAVKPPPVIRFRSTTTRASTGSAPDAAPPASPNRRWLGILSQSRRIRTGCQGQPDKCRRCTSDEFGFRCQIGQEALSRRDARLFLFPAVGMRRSSWSIDRRHRFLELPLEHQTLFYAGKELLAFTDERLGRAVSTTDNDGARGIRN